MKPRLNQIPFDEAAGKTILAVFIDDYPKQALVSFTDGSFCIIDHDPNYGDPQVCFDGDFSSSCWPDDQLLAAGMVTQEDIDERDAEKINKENGERQAREDKEYRDYLNLKAKFEPREP
jgi:hypothetical protein